MEIWNNFVALAERYLGVEPHVVTKLFLTALVIVAYFILRRIMNSIVSRRTRDIAKQYVARKTIITLLGFVALVVIIRVWIKGPSGVAAYLGILSAGLAIALQDPLTNLAGWIFITARKPLVVGERIEINGHRGDVIDVRLFQFSIIEIGNWVDADQSTGRIIHIPNGWSFKHSTANFTQGFNFIWNELPITITFESDWKKAKELLLEIAGNHSAVQSDQAEAQIREAARKYLIFFQHLTPIVWTSVADIGVTLTIRYLCEPRKRRSSEMAIWEDILIGFAEHDDIDFAYPTTRFYHNAIEGKSGARAEMPST